MKLRLGGNLLLPPQAVTQTFAILAKRGMGKTYTGAVMVEEMLMADHQVVVADPIGVWYGLRSSSDGKKDGLNIIVFGGEHADAPLEETAGEMIATAIVEHGFSAVLDLSLLRKSAQVRFMTDFAETLYRINRRALHLVADEADAFAPQRPMPGEQRLLGAFEDIVRRGRARGLGVTLITQRAAVLNKNVLTQIEVLVVLRTIAPQDREAIDAWIEVHGTPEQRQAMMESLPSLPRGHAWFWSPGWLDIFKRVEIRPRITFDSSATPEVGKVKVAPKLSEVDIEKLGEKILKSVETAKANDPRELKAKIAALQKQLASAKPVEVPIEVSILTDEDRSLIRGIESGLDKFGQGLSEFKRSLQELVAKLPITAQAVHRSASHLKPDRGYELPNPARGRATTTAIVAVSGLTHPQLRIVNAIALLSQVTGRTAFPKEMIAVHAGASPRSSAFLNNLGSLRSSGAIDYPQPGFLCLLEKGQQLAESSPEPPATLSEYHDRWLRIISNPQAQIVRAVIECHPEMLSKEDLANRAGASVSSSAFLNNLGSLRTLGAIDYPRPGFVCASPNLFPEGLA